MPGSRKNEVEKLLPAMLKAADILTEKCECQFFLPRAGTISSEFIQDFLKKCFTEIGYHCDGRPDI